MPKEGWSTITVRDERLLTLQNMYERDPVRPATQRFGAWFDNFVYELAAYEDERRVYGAFIDVESVTDKHIILTDNMIHKHVFVNVNAEAKRLECELDESSTCNHVGFCLGIPAVYKNLIKQGFKTKLSATTNINIKTEFPAVS